MSSKWHQGSALCARLACVSSYATQNVRVLEGGNGSKCLAFGKVQSSVEDDLTGFRVMTPTKEAEPK